MNTYLIVISHTIMATTLSAQAAETIYVGGFDGTRRTS